LYDLRVAPSRVSDRIRAWKPPVPGVREVFHARFAEHAYPPHTHDTWTLFIVDDGAIRYDLDRHPGGAGITAIGVLPPGVVHDGRPATDHGFTKRVIYLETSVLGDNLIGRAVDRPLIVDPTLRRQVSNVHRVLVGSEDCLEAETRLAFIAERLRAHLGARTDNTQWHPPNELAEQLRAFLDLHLFETVTLESAGAAVGASPTHLARCFSKTFGIAPHRYVLGRRIESSRRRLLEGQPLAEVAISAGFHDQAHFTRHFKRHLGVTPGRYVRAPIGEEPTDPATST
jgi:AraC-like DNA-binding protein